MIRLTTIFFLILQLLTNTELCQLIKLPLLIEHYREHDTMNKGIPFIAFLKMHYFNGDPKDPDYDKDMQLPFKTNAGALLITHNYSTPVVASSLALVLPVIEIDNYYNKYFSIWTSSENFNEIFQPPRFS